MEMLGKMLDKFLDVAERYGVKQFVEDHGSKVIDNKIYNWVGDHGPFGPQGVADKWLSKGESLKAKYIGSPEDRLFTAEAKSRAKNNLFWGAIALLIASRLPRLPFALATVGITAVTTIPAMGVLAVNAIRANK